MNLYEDKNFNYSDIFNQRGDDYHRAMKLLPSARDHEFNSLLSQVTISDGMTIADIPSGGNYLSNYIKEDVHIIPLETSEVFAKLGNSRVCDWSSLPMEEKSVDIVFCCAAFHHVIETDRKKFMNEVSRVLKPQGKLVIADVKETTAVDNFLNGFVNEFNSLGHVGVFMNADFAKQYETENLKAEGTQFLEFPWILSRNLETSIAYLKLMFGIDKATPEMIKDHIVDHLNFKKNKEELYSIDWALNYVVYSKEA